MTAIRPSVSFGVDHAPRAWIKVELQAIEGVCAALGVWNPQGHFDAEHTVERLCNFAYGELVERTAPVSACNNACR